LIANRGLERREAIIEVNSAVRAKKA